MSPLEDLARKALDLDLRDRAKLAERLLDSLDHLSETEIEELWIAEAEGRLADYRAGRTEAIPAEEVFREADQLIR